MTGKRYNSPVKFHNPISIFLKGGLQITRHAYSHSIKGLNEDIEETLKQTKKLYGDKLELIIVNTTIYKTTIEKFEKPEPEYYFMGELTNSQIPREAIKKSKEQDDINKGNKK